jgi:hypothetical protein
MDSKDLVTATVAMTIVTLIASGRQKLFVESLTRSSGSVATASDTDITSPL